MKSPGEEIKMTPPKRNTHIASTKQNQQTKAANKVGLVRTKRSRTEQQSQDVKQQQKNMAATYMTSISYDVLVHIFQYLEVHELLRAAQVCTVWRDTVSNQCLWKTVRIDTDWRINLEGMADTLKKRRTQYLSVDSDALVGNGLDKAWDTSFWLDLSDSISQVSSLVKLELRSCPAMVIEDVIVSCPQLKVLSAVSIEWKEAVHDRVGDVIYLNLGSVGNLTECQELRISATGHFLFFLQNLTSLQELEQLTQLSLTNINLDEELEIIQTLTNLETLELGDCRSLPNNFGTNVLSELNKLKCLRLEEGDTSYFTLDILESVSKLQNLSQIELIKFRVDDGFDECLAKCKNIKRLLIVPMWNQDRLNNTNDEEYYRKILPNLIREGVMRLSNTLEFFLWGILKEEEFCEEDKDVVYLNFIGNFEKEKQSLVTDNGQMKMTLSYFEELLSMDLPKTRVNIVSLPFSGTKELRISDIATRRG